MLFNSYEFILVFLPISFFVYFYLLSVRMVVAAKGWLVFSSLFFYSWWNIAYLYLILCSILFNFLVGHVLNDNLKNLYVNKKLLLFIGILANIALLSYYKYSDFFIENINLVFDSSFSLMYMVLPLAISFFTFQQIAYLVDSYYGKTREHDFLNYSLFVSFFPQLIAGPIVHHSEMMPQFNSKWNFVRSYKNISIGIFIFSMGLFKKVVIADSFSKWATAGFDNSQVLNMAEAWATSLSYTFQLYFDFSGYTDMAIGVALLFNIKLPINFNSPYKSLDIQDFWRRWHITLSRFLRDYIYIPLGGNRKGSIRMVSNILATFIIGGIWHGAGWTFVFWGFLHGVALIIHRAWKSAGLSMPGPLAWFITFNFVNVAWVFFRAKEWGDATKVLKGMVSLNYDYPMLDLKIILENIDGNSKTVIYLAVCLVAVIVMKNSSFYRDNFVVNKRSLYLSFLMLFYSVISMNQVSEFIYYNF